jgi:uncharacterized membrane protein YgcG
MKQHIRMFSVLLILTFLLVSCETEEVYLKENQHQVDNNRVKLLKGDEAKKILYQLNSKLSGLGGSTLNDNIRLRTNGQSIDFNSILQVIDTLGIKNYTFRISNHPDDDYKTFHNLVVTDKGTEIETTLMKYEMTEQFAAAYNQSLKLFQQFEGKVTATGFPLSPLSPVPCEEIVKEFNPIPVYEPNPVHNPGGSSPSGGGGSGGSFGGAGTGNGSGSGTGSGGGNSNGATCIEAIARIFCSCGRNYGSLGDYAGSICGDWETNPGYEVYLGFIYVASNNCRLAADPCNPDGVIGILEPIKDEDPCKELEKLVNPNEGKLKPDIDWLKDKAGGKFEFAVEVEKSLNYDGETFNYPTTRKESTEQYNAHAQTGSTIIGSMHCHPAESYGIPSFGDVRWLRNCYKEASPSRKPYAFSMVVVKNSDGTKSVYAMMINDFEKLNIEVNKELNHSDYAELTTEREKLEKIHENQARKYKDSNGQLEKSFLQQFGSFGIDIYKATDENLTNWNKLTLENNNNQLEVVPEPCN